MSYTITAQDKDGRVLWTHDVPATSFDSAVSIVTRYGGMAGVHSLLVTKG
jgi:hypothetical protein